MIVHDTNTTSATTRQGEYFWKTLDVANSSSLFATTNLRTIARMTQSTTSLVRVESRQAIVPKTPETLSWDADGNLSCDGVWTNEWDAQNRLVAVESVAGMPDNQKRRVEYRHDWMGRLAERKAMSGWAAGGYNVTNVTLYAWDGWLPVAEVCGASTNFFTYGIDVGGDLQTAGGVGGLVLLSLGGTNCMPVFDGNGNVMGLVKADDGTLVAEYEYSPAGETLKCEGVLAKANHFRFSTKLADDTGLILYPVRPYNPRHQCFLSRDPIGEEGGLNLHGLCGNDWANWVDGWGFIDNGRTRSGTISMTLPSIKDNHSSYVVWFYAKVDVSPVANERRNITITVERPSDSSAIKPDTAIPDVPLEVGEIVTTRPYNKTEDWNTGVTQGNVKSHKSKSAYSARESWNEQAGLEYANLLFWANPQVRKSGNLIPWPKDALWLVGDKSKFLGDLSGTDWTVGGNYWYTCSWTGNGTGPVNKPNSVYHTLTSPKLTVIPSDTKGQCGRVTLLMVWGQETGRNSGKSIGGIVVNFGDWSDPTIDIKQHLDLPSEVRNWVDTAGTGEGRVSNLR